MSTKGYLREMGSYEEVTPKTWEDRQPSKSHGTHHIATARLGAGTMPTFIINAVIFIGFFIVIMLTESPGIFSMSQKQAFVAKRNVFDLAASPNPFLFISMISWLASMVFTGFSLVKMGYKSPYLYMSMNMFLGLGFIFSALGEACFVTEGFAPWLPFLFYCLATTAVVGVYWFRPLASTLCGGKFRYFVPPEGIPVADYVLGDVPIKPWLAFLIFRLASTFGAWAVGAVDHNLGWNMTGYACLFGGFVLGFTAFAHCAYNWDGIFTVCVAVCFYLWGNMASEFAGTVAAPAVHYSVPMLAWSSSGILLTLGFASCVKAIFTYKLAGFHFL